MFSIQKFRNILLIVLGLFPIGYWLIKGNRYSKNDKITIQDQLIVLKKSYLFRLQYREEYEESIKSVAEKSGLVINLPKFEIINLNTATKLELENAIEEEFDRMNELRTKYSLNGTPANK
jgi:hypothetical protein